MSTISELRQAGSLQDIAGALQRGEVSAVELD